MLQKFGGNGAYGRGFLLNELAHVRPCELPQCGRAVFNVRERRAGFAKVGIAAIFWIYGR